MSDFLDFAKLPLLSSAQIVHSNENIEIKVKYSIKDYVQDERKRTLESNVLLDPKLSPIFHSTPLENEKSVKNVFTSLNGKYSVVQKMIDDKLYCEIWKDKVMTHNFQVKEHGPFSTDSVFGNGAFNESRGLLVYTPEMKRPEKDEKDFLYRSDWGERYTGKFHSCICVLDLNNGSIKMETFQKICPADIQFVGNDKLVFTGYKKDPRQYGLAACMNRHSAIYVCSIDNFAEDNVQALRSPFESSRSPRVSHCGQKIAFLSNKPSGAHYATAGLFVYDLILDTFSTLIPIEKQVIEGFPGIYTDKLPQNCWIGSNIIFHSIWRTKQSIFLVDSSNGKVVDLFPGNTSCSILHVNSNLVLAHTSSPISIPQLVQVTYV